MVNLFQRLFGRRSAGKAGQAVRQARLGLEQLEGRDVPSTFVTFYGGQIIPHAQVTNVYYGQDWSQQANKLDITNLNGFTSIITQSSYMSMLGEYGVGQGSYKGYDVQASGPAANTTVSESAIQNMLVAEIQWGRVPWPTSSTVYTVYLPPNVHSQLDNQINSLGHHNSFTPWQINYQQIYYVVIPHPQGNLADNGYHLNGLSDFQKQTEIVSHQLADTVTEPRVWQGSNGIWSGIGWHWSPGSRGEQFTLGQEIGDFVNEQVAWLNGYAVQREWSNYWQTGIVPAYETFGGFIGNANTPFYSIHTQEGRSGGLNYQGFGRPQVSWQLDDGSWSGWYILG
jgi:hypothetical protein